MVELLVIFWVASTGAMIGSSFKSAFVLVFLFSLSAFLGYLGEKEFYLQSPLLGFYDTTLLSLYGFQSSKFHRATPVEKLSVFLVSRSIFPKIKTLSPRRISPKSKLALAELSSTSKGLGA